MQEIKGREERLLVSRHPVFVFMLLSAFVHYPAQCVPQPESLGLAWLLYSSSLAVCAKT